MLPLIHRLLYTCAGESEQKEVQACIGSETEQYRTCQQKPLLDAIWALEKAIRTKQSLTILYRNLDTQDKTEIRLQPLAVFCASSCFYLIACPKTQENIPGTKTQQPELTVYRVDWIRKIHVESEPVSQEEQIMAERLKAGEWSGRVKLQCGNDRGVVEKIREWMPGGEVEEMGEKRKIIL